MHHKERIAVLGSTVEEAAIHLQSAVESHTSKNHPSSRPNIAFAFTGQGSHYLGMGKVLYRKVFTFRSDIDRYDQLARQQGFCSILPMIAANEEIHGSSPSLLVQLATTSLQMALSKLWISLGIVPELVIGHSLGHYAALNVAGVLSEADTIYLVGIRAHQLQKHCEADTHSMLAVRAAYPAVQPFLQDSNIEIACLNGPQDLVLGGSRQEVEDLHSQLISRSIESSVLDMQYAFHSSQVQPLLNTFEKAARCVTFHKPCIPVICPLTKEIVRDSGIFGPGHLAMHYRRPVDMVGALESARNTGLVGARTFFIEIGHHNTVTSILRAILGSGCFAYPSMRKNVDTWKLQGEILCALYMAGIDVRWSQYQRDFRSENRVLPLPAYHWDLKDYWMKYVHDWSLRKGDPSPLAPRDDPCLVNGLIHRVVEENLVKVTGAITVQTDLGHPDLRDIVHGHKVHGITLCTPVRSTSTVRVLHAKLTILRSLYMLQSLSPLLNTYKRDTNKQHFSRYPSMTWSSMRRWSLLLKEFDV